MKAFLAIFTLEFRAVVRSRALAILLALSVAWMFAMPLVVKSDGSDEGARVMYVQYALGGVFALTLVALVAAAAGSLAKDRAGRRLALTLVRPVGPAVIALARFAALVSAGAVVLAVAAGILAARSDLSRGCDHVLSPVMESPRAEAERMYEVFMQDPDTPREVREAKREEVVRILTQRAAEHYQSIATNATAKWIFRVPADAASGPFAVRLRFTNMYDMREDVAGEFRLGGFAGEIRDVTKSVTRVPLEGAPGAAPAEELVFANRGAGELMLRPRRDIGLLVGADGFGMNLVRAYLELVAVLGAALAVALFLGAGLGRSTAVFAAVTLLVIAAISPAVVEQCPVELDTARGDRIGLALTRFAAAVTSPLTAASPLEHLAADECIEADEVGLVMAVDLVLFPLVFALLSAAVLPRKNEEGD